MESALVDFFDTFHGPGYNGTPSGRGHGGQDKVEPVTVRGVTYPSPKACAAALDLDPNTVRQARKRGTLDSVGLGHENMGKTLPVVWRGTRFETQDALVKHLRRSRKTIRRAIEEGRIDSLDIRENDGNRGKRMPVTWRGIPFHSQLALAEHLNLPRKIVRKAMREGRVDSLERRE